MSANTEHGRALAALGQNYANATTQIYQQQGENAARDVLQRGQIKGQLIQNVGQTIGQVLGPAVQQGIQQRKENQIKAVLQSYNNDLEKALPEILAIDRDVAMKMADQIHKQKIWVYDYKKLEHDSEGQKLQKVASKVYDIHDQATLTQARYALQQLGADISQYPTVYNEPEIKQLQERTRRVYEAWQGNFPKQPEPLRLGKDDTLVEPGTYKPVAYGSNAGPNAKPEEPPPGTPAHEAWVEKQRLATAGQPAAPAAAPVAAPLAALSAPTSLSVEQVEGRPPAAAPATPAAPARPAAPAATAPTTPETPAPYGNRYGTQTPKGDGFLGPLLRPDGKTMSEFSIDVTMDGKPVQIPTIVPTLTRSEIMQILHMKENDPLPQAIANKAVAHARQRIAAGKDPFAGPGEQQLKFPDLVVKTAGTAPPAASAAPTAPPAPKSDLDAWTQAYENIRVRRTKETADKPPTTGSFEDYLTRYAAAKRKTVAELTTTDIEAARKRYQQADDRGVDPALALLRDLAIDKAKQDAQDRIGQLPPALARRVDSRVKAFDQQPVAKRAAVMAEAVKFAQGMDPNTTNPADDQALLYAFAKGMDPESVVREGEYATVQKYAQSWADTFKFDAQRIFSNKPFLTPEARQNMKATIAAKFEATRAMYDGVRGSFANQINAITQQDDGETYLTDYGAAFPQAPATTPPPPAAATATPTPAPALRNGYQWVKGPNGEEGQTPIGAPLPAGWKVVP